VEFCHSTKWERVAGELFNEFSLADSGNTCGLHWHGRGRQSEASDDLDLLGEKTTMKIISVIFLLVFVSACSVSSTPAPPPPPPPTAPNCFINVSWNTMSHSYVGNVVYPYVLIQGGINIPVGCYTSKVTFLASFIDNVSPSDRLDIGLYCLSGPCTANNGANQLFVHVGGLQVNSGEKATSFFPCLVSTPTQEATCQTGQQSAFGTLNTLSWTEGTTYLPPGNYMWAMDDTCNPPGAGCSQGLGEGGTLHSQMFPFKYFTNATAVSCIQQNMGALPSSLPSSCVGNGGPPDNWALQAPHIIAAAVY